MPEQLTNTQRQYLRRLAHDLRPMVQVGKNGVTTALIESLNQALESHELIKVKFLDFQDQKHALAEELAEQSDSIVIGIIGNIATMFREQPDPEKRKINLPATHYRD